MTAPVNPRTERFAPRPFLTLSVCLVLSASSIALSNGATLANAVEPEPRNQPFIAVTSAIPRLVETDYIELSKIASISKFRSAEGHDYSDDFESCRSMKHYFKPDPHLDWSAVRIFSPVRGNILRVEEEWAGRRVEIQAEQCPALAFIIYHVKLSKPLWAGDKVSAGQWLGFHIGKATYSDIAVRLNTPAGSKLVSYFEAMPDSVFEGYRRRGLTTRAEIIISKESRDADPLRCAAGAFTSHGRIAGWVNLSSPP